jgi:hypothetical protein
MTASQAMFFGAGGVAGVRGSIGRATLAAEVVGGIRMTSLSVESTYGTCVLGDTHRHYTTFVEPRLHLGFWLSPWVSIGGFAGGDLTGDSQVAGASLAFHVRAFDRGW